MEYLHDDLLDNSNCLKTIIIEYLLIYKNCNTFFSTYTYRVITFCYINSIKKEEFRK